MSTTFRKLSFILGTIFLCLLLFVACTANSSAYNAAAMQKCHAEFKKKAEPTNDDILDVYACFIDEGLSPLGNHSQISECTFYAEYIEIHDNEVLEYLGFNPEDNNYEIYDEPIDKAEAKLSSQKDLFNHLYAKRIEGGSEPLLNNEVFVNELIRKAGGNPNGFAPFGLSSEDTKKTIKKLMKEYKMCENIFGQMETAIAEELSP